MRLTRETVGEPGEYAVNRRASRRFALYAEVTYKLLAREGLAGTGETLNVGSGGVAFTTEHNLPVNEPVEVSINWPARLNGACALKLVVTGHVLRSQEQRAVVKIERYVFRTRAAVGWPAARAATALADLQRPDSESKPSGGYAIAR
jgi:hypothetical protein